MFLELSESLIQAQLRPSHHGKSPKRNTANSWRSSDCADYDSISAKLGKPHNIHQWGLSALQPEGDRRPDMIIRLHCRWLSQTATSSAFPRSVTVVNLNPGSLFSLSSFGGTWAVAIAHSASCQGCGLLFAFFLGSMIASEPDYFWVS